METIFLERLLELASQDTGAVYWNAQGFYEPLAAVYPKSAARSAKTFLTNGGRRMQNWLFEGVEAGWMQSVALRKEEEVAFLNVNTYVEYTKLAE